MTQLGQARSLEAQVEGAVCGWWQEAVEGGQQVWGQWVERTSSGVHWMAGGVGVEPQAPGIAEVVGGLLLSERFLRAGS